MALPLPLVAPPCPPDLMAYPCPLSPNLLAATCPTQRMTAAAARHAGFPSLLAPLGQLQISWDRGLVSGDLRCWGSRGGGPNLGGQVEWGKAAGWFGLVAPRLPLRVSPTSPCAHLQLIFVCWCCPWEAGREGNPPAQPLLALLPPLGYRSSLGWAHPREWQWWGPGRQVSFPCLLPKAALATESKLGRADGITRGRRVGGRIGAYTNV